MTLHSIKIYANFGCTTGLNESERAEFQIIIIDKQSLLQKNPSVATTHQN